MIKAWHLLRVALGVIFFVFGINGLVGFLPPPELSPEGQALLNSMVNSGYLFTLVKATEIFAGFLLLSNRFVPLALVALAPITVNILFFHLFLDRSGLPISVFLLVSNITLAFGMKRTFKPFLKAKNHIEF